MKRGFEMYLNVKISKTNAKKPKKGFLFGKKGLIPFLRLSVINTLNIRFCRLLFLLCEKCAIRGLPFGWFLFAMRA